MEEQLVCHLLIMLELSERSNSVHGFTMMFLLEVTDVTHRSRDTKAPTNRLNLFKVCSYKHDVYVLF